MGGRCSLNRSFRTITTHTHPNVKYNKRKGSPSQRENLPSGLPYFIATSDGHLIYKTSEPYGKIQTIESHFSAANDETHSTTPKYQWSPSNNRNTDHMWKNGEEVIPKDRTSESSVTITVAENSTSLPESLDECSSDLELKSNTNLIKNISHYEGSKVTNLPSEVINQLRKLVNTDDPETKAVAEQLLNYLAKLPTSEKNKTCREVVDLDISVEQNNVTITSELVKDCDHCVQFKMYSVPVNRGKLVAHCDSSKLEWTNDGENEPALSGSEDYYGVMMGRMLQNDEETKCPQFDVIEFSKQQLIKTHRKSLLMTEVLDNMPSLAQSINGNRRDSTKNLIIKDGVTMSKDMNLETMTSEIDDLDKKIAESKQKLTVFRRKSLDLLFSDGDDPSDSAEEGKHLSLLHVEREINRWQDHKHTLEDKRDKIITNLNMELMGNLKANELVCDRLTSRSHSQ